MKKIKLTQGGEGKPIKYALLDDEDYERVYKFHTWYCTMDRKAEKKGIERYNAKCEKDGKSIRLKRFILGVTDPDLNVCHRNGDKLDFRRNNLLIYARFYSERTAHYPTVRSFGPPVTINIPRGFEGSLRKTLFKGTLVEIYDREKSHKVMANELRARGLSYGAISKVLAHRGFKTDNGKPFSRSRIVEWTRLRKSRHEK
jgi:hypothetical protein